MNNLVTLSLSEVDKAPTSLGSGVHKIICLTTDKFYIGGTRDLRARWKEHRSTLRKNRHSSPKLQQAFNAYGESNFIVAIIEFCPRTELKQREQHYLDLYTPHETGYNILPSAQSLRGRKWPAEACRKKSIRMRGNTLSLGRKHSTETLAKIRASNSRRIISQETKEKMRFKKLGKPLSVEHRAKLSAALKGRDMSEVRALSSANKKGCVKPVEQRAKISATLIKQYEGNRILTGCCSRFN